MLSGYEKQVLKQAIGLVLCNEQNPRDVADWFAERVVPGDWIPDVLLFLFQQARAGACLSAMEHFLDINRCSIRRRRRLRDPELRVDIPFLTNASVEHDPFDL